MAVPGERKLGRRAPCGPVVDGVATKKTTITGANVGVVSWSFRPDDVQDLASSLVSYMLMERLSPDDIDAQRCGSINDCIDPLRVQ